MITSTITLRRTLATALMALVALNVCAAETDSVAVKTDSVAAETDSVAAKPKSWYDRGVVGKVIDYFASANKTVLTRRPSFSFIGGPHYSSDTGVGIGLVAAGLYSTAPEDTTLQPSNVSLFADLTTGGYYEVGIEGLHIYRGGARRVDYELSFNSYDTYFWGVGYEKARINANKSKYLLLDVMLQADHLWRIGDTPVFAGPLVKFNYMAARHIEHPVLWAGLDRSFAATGAGFKVQLDTRDNYTDPHSGWMAELIQRLYPRIFGNGPRTFGSTEFSVNKYVSVWRGGIVAARLHGSFTYGDVPWGMMPTVGGSHTLRGYYEERYRDKCESDFTVELRQHVVRRSGVAVWAGLGSVFPSFDKFRKQDLLPNYGIGYRWEFKRLTNVRVDAGFGKKCWGVVLSINEAF